MDDRTYESASSAASAVPEVEGTPATHRSTRVPVLAHVPWLSKPPAAFSAATDAPMAIPSAIDPEYYLPHEQLVMPELGSSSDLLLSVAPSQQRRVDMPRPVARPTFHASTSAGVASGERATAERPRFVPTTRAESSETMSPHEAAAPSWRAQPGEAKSPVASGAGVGSLGSSQATSPVAATSRLAKAETTSTSTESTREAKSDSVEKKRFRFDPPSAVVPPEPASLSPRPAGKPADWQRRVVALDAGFRKYHQLIAVATLLVTAGLMLLVMEGNANQHAAPNGGLPAAVLPHGAAAPVQQAPSYQILPSQAAQHHTARGPVSKMRNHSVAAQPAETAAAEVAPSQEDLAEEPNRSPEPLPQEPRQQPPVQPNVSDPEEREMPAAPFSNSVPSPSGSTAFPLLPPGADTVPPGQIPYSSTNYPEFSLPSPVSGSWSHSPDR